MLKYQRRKKKNQKKIRSNLKDEMNDSADATSKYKKIYITMESRKKRLSSSRLISCFQFY